VKEVSHVCNHLLVADFQSDLSANIAFALIVFVTEEYLNIYDIDNKKTYDDLNKK